MLFDDAFLMTIKTYNYIPTYVWTSRSGAINFSTISTKRNSFENTVIIMDSKDTKVLLIVVIKIDLLGFIFTHLYGKKL